MTLMKVTTNPALNLMRLAEDAPLQDEPYPHLIARDVLPAELVARLIEEFPAIDVVTGDGPIGNNARFSYSAYKLLTDPRVSDTWRQLVAAQLDQDFLNGFLARFRPAIQQHLPALVQRFGPDLALRAGVRRQDSIRTADVLLESQICVNTPVTLKTTVRGPHVDMPDKLFAGLFYLRHPDDRSAGGDLQIYRWRKQRTLHDGQFIDDADVEVVSTLPYESNLLVLFLNGIDAIHGVTPREPTPYPRMFLNLFGELPRPLFDLNRYQKDRSALRRARYAWQLAQKRIAREVWGWRR